LWSLAGFIDVCAPVKFWTHYYFALYPPVCIAGAMALGVVTQNRVKYFATGLTVLFMTAAPFWIVGEALADRRTDPDAPRAVAEYLRQAGANDMNVFVYDYNPAIYALAHVKPPTPYVLSIELAQFSYSAGVDGKAEVERVMHALPEFVVLRTRVRGEQAPAVLDDVVARGLATYHVVYQVADTEDDSIVRVYKRSF
jgi:hypothetical protein